MRIDAPVQAGAPVRLPNRIAQELIMTRIARRKHPAAEKTETLEELLIDIPTAPPPAPAPAPAPKAAITLRGQRPICIGFSSPVNNQTASAFMATLAKAVNDGFDDLHILLSSPGGGVADGIATYNFMRALPVPVTTYNIGTVDSIGNVIFQGGTRRVANPTSRFMFHGVGFDIQQARFELKQLRERSQGIENDQAMIADIMVRHTKLSTDDIEKLFLEAAFIRSIDAKDRGIVDEVVDIHLPPGIPVLQLVFQG
jgi:ATP-dependent Clp protease protease subunit